MGTRRVELVVGSTVEAFRRRQGFTLIELIVVVAVIGILLALAVSSYQNSVMRTRRSLAATCLMERAQFMERFYTSNLTYLGGGAALPVQQCTGDLVQFYSLPVPTETATTFLFTATPIGAQVNEPCGALTISNTGARTPTTDGCW